MNRRAFLRFLGLAPIVAPAVVTQIAAAASAPLPPMVLGQGRLGASVLGPAAFDHRRLAKLELQRWMAETIDREMLDSFDRTIVEIHPGGTSYHSMVGTRQWPTRVKLQRTMKPGDVIEPPSGCEATPGRTDADFELQRGGVVR